VNLFAGDLEPADKELSRLMIFPISRLMVINLQNGSSLNASRITWHTLIYLVKAPVAQPDRATDF
jgi:hypothetical protein